MLQYFTCESFATLCLSTMGQVATNLVHKNLDKQQLEQSIHNFSTLNNHAKIHVCKQGQNALQRVYFASQLMPQEYPDRLYHILNFVRESNVGDVDWLNEQSLNNILVATPNIDYTQIKSLRQEMKQYCLNNDVGILNMIYPKQNTCVNCSRKLVTLANPAKLVFVN